MTAATAKSNRPGAEVADRLVHVPTWVWAFLAAGSSGCLMALSLPPWGYHFLAWVALVPWLIMLPKLSPGRVWLLGTVLGLVFYRLSIGWLFGLHGLLGGITIIALSVWMGLAFRVVRLLMDRFSIAVLLWAAPIAIVGQEVCRCEGMDRIRFAYGAFGHSQAGNPWISQIASLGGVYSISVALVAVNAALAYALIRRRGRGWIPACVIAASVLLAAAMAQPSDFHKNLSVPVACVQAEESDYRAYITLAELALAGPNKPRYIVMPEHTIVTFADRPNRFVEALSTLARENGIHICVGAHVSPSAGGDCDYDNVGLLLGPDGQTIGMQAKAVPLPFFHDGNPASEQRTFPTEAGRVGIYVCYDGSFTDVPRRAVSRGAEVLLVPVMNPARWPLQQRLQQAGISRFRSIELRRCAVRAASSGTSQIIDASGRIVADRTQSAGAGVICGEVWFSDVDTVFLRGGYLVPQGIGVLFLFLVVLFTLTEWINSFALFKLRRNLT